MREDKESELKRQQSREVETALNEEEGEDIHSEATKKPTTNGMQDYPDPVYNKYECYVFCVIVALGQVCSTISVPMLFPALTPISEYFDVSTEHSNLLQTMYTIFQGISPALFASMSDAVGRKPVYLFCYTVYCAATIGQALATNYWMLFGFRCAHAMGISTAVSMVGAVIGDISQRQNRGMLMSTAQGIGQLGNCLGPVIGGVLMSRWSWRSLFWALLILGAFSLLLTMLILPETSRAFTGNGSVMPRKPYLRTPYAYIRHKLTGLPLLPNEDGYEKQWVGPRKRINLLKFMWFFRQPDFCLQMVPMSLFFMTWWMSLTAQTNILYAKYGYTTTQVGLTYLSSGLGTLITSALTGRIIQYTYRRDVAKFEKDCAAAGIEPLFENFNIHKARLFPQYYATAVIVVFTLIFGWTLDKGVSAYVPVAMTFFIAAAATFAIAASSTIVIDLFPEDAAAAMASVNIGRCLSAAVGLAVIDRMMKTMTIGGTFTFLAGLCLLSTGFTFILIRYGKLYAKKRAQAKAIDYGS